MRKLGKAFILGASCCCLLTGCNNGSGGGNASSDNSASSQNEVKDYYTMTFDLNYEGSTAKSIQVKAGTRASKYKATRSGYTLDNWYNTKDCNSGDTFDFLTYINKDTTVYAKWVKNVGKVNVTFDANYEGGFVTTVAVDEGSKISASSIPDCPKLGYQYEGWYKDAACTQEWDFANDAVTSAITLYANYKLDTSVERDNNGSIAFEDVVVNLFAGGTLVDTAPVLIKLIDSFNEEYEGKIKVQRVDTIADSTQSYYSLRCQQIPGANADITTNYYSAQDVYEFAGIPWSKGDWYEDASRDSYVNGQLYSVPLVAGVPYIAYNKEMMAKYNPDGASLDSYASFSALLKKVYEGESGANSSFRTFVTGTNWPFKECASYASFIQNGADYYVYENGSYVNKWVDDEGNVSQNAVNALTNIYNAFGDGGELHGGTTEDSYADNLGIGEVASGAAFMDLINVPKSSETVLSNSSKVGYLPLSGVFASSDSPQKDQIPVHTIGFQFYKAKNVDLTQLAAAAVFADYVSRNSYSYAEIGWYPLRKEVVSSAAFANSTNKYVKLLKSIGDPEDFRTLDGFYNGKYIFNTIAAEQYIADSGILSKEASEVDSDYIKGEVESLASTIASALA